MDTTNQHAPEVMLTPFEVTLNSAGKWEGTKIAADALNEEADSGNSKLRRFNWPGLMIDLKLSEGFIRLNPGSPEEVRAPGSIMSVQWFLIEAPVGAKLTGKYRHAPDAP